METARTRPDNLDHGEGDHSLHTFGCNYLMFDTHVYIYIYINNIHPKRTR